MRPRLLLTVPRGLHAAIGRRDGSTGQEAGHHLKTGLHPPPGNPFFVESERYFETGKPRFHLTDI